MQQYIDSNINNELWASSTLKLLQAMKESKGMREMKERERVKEK